MTSDMNAILIRQFVDGELSGDALASFEAQLASNAELQAAVAFERSLRDRVSDAMSGPEFAAPADLRAKLAAAMSSADLSEYDAEGDDFEDDVPVIGTIQPGGASNGAQSQPWRGWAIAASLLLVASAVLFGIFGPSINQPPPSGTLVSDIAEKAAVEHRSCAMDKSSLAQKLVYQDPATAGSELSRVLQYGVTILDLTVDDLEYEFMGGAACSLPGCSDVVHLMYGREKSESRGGALVSVYVTPDLGNIKALPKCPKGSSIWTAADASQKCSMQVNILQAGDMMYVICCCDPHDVEAVKQAVATQLTAAETR